MQHDTVQRHLVNRADQAAGPDKTYMDMAIHLAKMESKDEKEPPRIGHCSKIAGSSYFGVGHLHNETRLDAP